MRVLSPISLSSYLDEMAKLAEVLLQSPAWAAAQKLPEAQQVAAAKQYAVRSPANIKDVVGSAPKVRGAPKVSATPKVNPTVIKPSPTVIKPKPSWGVKALKGIGGKYKPLVIAGAALGGIGLGKALTSR